MKGRGWRWRAPGRRRLALALALSLPLVLLSLLVGSPKGRAGQEEEEAAEAHCPSSLQEALGQWGWEEGPPMPMGGDDGGGGGGGDDGGGAGKGRRRRHIYLHATWRTGSSLVGELFNQHPEVFYLYEPVWHLWQALFPGDALSLQGALRDMLGSLFRCDFSVLRLYASGSNLSTRSLFGWRTNKAICSAPLCAGSPWARSRVALVDGAACERSCPPRPLRELEAECRGAPVVAIKDVRLLELAALAPLLRDPGLDLRVVQIFRDPRAVHNSRLRARQALLRESLQVARSGGGGGPRRTQRRLPDGGPPRLHLPHPRAELLLGSALEVICQGWLRDLLLSRRPPPWLRSRYARLRYEDLVRDPRGEVRRLLGFAGLAAPGALQDFALNMTRGGGSGGGSSEDRPAFLLSPRDARQGLRAWKERLSTEQVRRAERACGAAMRLLRYPLSHEGGGGGGGGGEQGEQDAPG